MLSVDSWVSSSLNVYAHRSWVVDSFFALLARNDVLKGGAVILFYSWAWFRRHVEIAEQRQILICGLIGGIVAPWVARLVAITAPFRLRPLHNPALHWQLAYGTSPSTLLNWSSFPSDHAAMFAAFAMALFFVSRRAGIVLFAYVFALVDFARIYLGLHYLTDILVGTLIGIAVAYLSISKGPRRLVLRHIMPVLDRRPEYFYPGFIFSLYMVGTMFGPLHEILRYLIVVSHAPSGHRFAAILNSRWRPAFAGAALLVMLAVVLLEMLRGRSTDHALASSPHDPKQA
jgi:undecaprenyl-diphosphatase